jgi:HD superfamily phosphodiesterase
MFEKPHQWLDMVKQKCFPPNCILVREILPQLHDKIRINELDNHGALHVYRVCLYSEILAWQYGADPFASTLAAYCHDIGRSLDGTEHGHGAKSWEKCGEIIRQMVTIEQAECIKNAIVLHTQGLTSKDPITASLWDADRIDLIRFGHPPVLQKLDPARFSRPEALNLAKLMLPVDLNFALTINNIHY